MSYKVKEIFMTLQGEGVNVGRPAVFCRFSGCNLWSGHEVHRASAICRFCDTDFLGGETFPDAARLALAISSRWPGGPGRFVVLTGGEPALQVDAALISELHAMKFQVAIETNGTKALPEGIDWTTMSPKAGTDIVVTRGNELKLVYPQEGITPKMLEHLHFDHFVLSPMDGPSLKSNTAQALEYCMKNPPWRLSLQVHKIIGIR
jgi:7-carboxy-7-deazaguanine synthase (Cx14CxxC type)